MLAEGLRHHTNHHILVYMAILFSCIAIHNTLSCSLLQNIHASIHNFDMALCFLSLKHKWTNGFQNKTLSCSFQNDHSQFVTRIHCCAFYNADICDPVQQKGHFVGQVYSEIMNKIVCKI